MRMLDGIEPNVTAEIRHAAEHAPGIRQVLDVRARWLGHRLNAEVDVVLDGAVTVREADAITGQFERALSQHLPALSAVRIRVRASDSATQGAHSEAAHHHAPAPVAVRGQFAEGVVEIVDTPEGERLRFAASRATAGLQVVVTIQRKSGAPRHCHLAHLPTTHPGLSAQLRRKSHTSLMPNSAYRRVTAQKLCRSGSSNLRGTTPHIRW